MTNLITIIGLTLANTFWLFYLSGSLPGTVGRQWQKRRHQKGIDRRPDQE